MATIFSRRIIAFVMDFFVVSAFMWIVSFVIAMVVNPADTYSIYKYFPYVLPVLIMVYFVFCEKAKSATVGKALMYLQVVSKNGSKINWAQAIIRNLSKIYWAPVLFDWLIGRLLGSNERLLGSITKTAVVNERS